MELLYLITGIAAGFAVAFFLFKSRFTAKDGEQVKVIHDQENHYRQQINELEKKHAGTEARLSLLSGEKLKTEQELSSEREKLSVANQRLAKAEETFRNMKERMDTRQQEVKELLDNNKTEFKNIASDLLEEKSKKFTDQNKSNLDIILNPLKEKIKDFEDKVERTYKAESAERNILKGEINKLVELNKSISDEANNLTRALKGDTKKQGDWGEFRLEVILEKAGLVKGIHYHAQEAFKDEDGNSKRPDFIINLPDSKHLVIDSKVSLNAYIAYCESESEEEKEAHLKKHFESMEKHIRELSEKSYEKLYNIVSPNYVLMYVPVEPAFNIAVERRSDMYLWAFEKKNVVLVTTSTLLATLSTVASIWQQDKQKRNVLEIADAAGKLYEKFVGFTNDLVGVGTKMEDAKKMYVEAMKKLSEGRGNLVGQVERIKQLGAKVDKDKSIAAPLLDRASESGELLIEE